MLKKKGLTIIAIEEKARLKNSALTYAEKALRKLGVQGHLLTLVKNTCKPPQLKSPTTEDFPQHDWKQGKEFRAPRGSWASYGKFQARLPCEEGSSSHPGQKERSTAAPAGRWHDGLCKKYQGKHSKQEKIWSPQTLRTQGSRAEGQRTKASLLSISNGPEGTEVLRTMQCAISVNNETGGRRSKKTGTGLECWWSSPWIPQ